MGIKWITVEGLKTRVKRAYAEALEDNHKASASSSQPIQPNANVSDIVEIPPPPNAIGTDITDNTEMPRHNLGGRPKGTTNLYKAHVDKCCSETRNEITELYHSYYLKMKGNETSTDRLSIGQWSKRIPKGIYQFIHDQIKTKRNLPDLFSFSYSACQKRIINSNMSISTPGKNCLCVI